MRHEETHSIVGDTLKHNLQTSLTASICDLGPFSKHVTVEGEGGGHEICDKSLREFRGEGVSTYPYLQLNGKIYNFCNYLTEISMPFQYITSKLRYNRICNFMHIYCHCIDIYLCLFPFKSPRRTTFRFKVLHFLLKSLRNEGGRVGAKLIYRYEA